MATPIKRAPKVPTKAQGVAAKKKQKQESPFKDMMLYNEQLSNQFTYDEVNEALGCSFEELVQSKKLEGIFHTFGCCAIVNGDSITTFDATGPAEVNFASEEQKEAVIEALQTGVLEHEYWGTLNTFAEWRDNTTVSRAAECGSIAHVFSRLFWINDSDALIAFTSAAGTLAETGSTLCVWNQAVGTLTRIQPYTEQSPIIVKRVYDVDSGEYCIFETDLAEVLPEEEVEVEETVTENTEPMPEIADVE